MEEYIVIVDGDVFAIELGVGGRAWVNRQPHEVDLRRVGEDGLRQSTGEYSLLLDNRSFEVHVADDDAGLAWVTVGGRTYKTSVQPCLDNADQPGDGNRGRGSGSGTSCEPARSSGQRVELRTPLPGVLVELHMGEGEQVAEQQLVAVLESMKMHLELRAPRNGVVRGVCVAPGQQVAQDEVLAVLEWRGVSPIS